MIPLYIFDLDGTLALIEHRRHLVERPSCLANSDGLHQCAECDGWSPNWSAFFKACVGDLPNWPVISTMHALLKTGADVQIWSGRSAEVMNETLDWLHRWVFGGDIDADEVRLTMRREGDFTPDDQLKAAWYDALSEFDKKRLVAIFDDRDKVVSMWRSKGVACFQVAPGEF